MDNYQFFKNLVIELTYAKNNRRHKKNKFKNKITTQCLEDILSNSQLMKNNRNPVTYTRNGFSKSSKKYVSSMA